MSKFMKKHFWDLMIILGILIFLLVASAVIYPSLVGYILGNVVLQIIILIILVLFAGVVGYYAWEGGEYFYKELLHSFKKKKK
jgi:flagellar basal body-associated protein FliL